LYLFSNPDSSFYMILYQSFNTLHFIYYTVSQYIFCVMLRARRCNVNPLRHAQNTPSHKAVCFDFWYNCTSTYGSWGKALWNSIIQTQ